MQIPPNFKRRSVISLIRKHSRLWLILGRPFEKGPSLLPADYCQRGLPFTSSGGRTEFVWKRDIRLGCKALRLKAKQAGQIENVQLPKELENRVNDFNNLHNPIFEFLFTRQGRPRPVPLGSWHA